MLHLLIRQFLWMMQICLPINRTQYYSKNCSQTTQMLHGLHSQVHHLILLFTPLPYNLWHLGSDPDRQASPLSPVLNATYLSVDHIVSRARSQYLQIFLYQYRWCICFIAFLRVFIFLYIQGFNFGRFYPRAEGELVLECDCFLLILLSFFFRNLRKECLQLSKASSRMENSKKYDSMS